MTEDNIVYKTREEATELFFLRCYDPEYRYFKHKMLMNEYNNIDKIIVNLKENLYEHLRSMIELEMIVNAIQYCNELGATAICVKKNRLHELGHMLAKMRDQDIQQFYKNIDSTNLEDIGRYMGYDKLKLTDNEYIESCKRYKETISSLSKIYSNFYFIYISYKLGLRIIPLKDSYGNPLFAAVSSDIHPHELKCLGCSDPATIQVQTSAIVNIIHHIYKKLYSPMIQMKYLELTNWGQSKRIESSYPGKAETNLIITASKDLPYWIFEDSKSKPKPFF